MKRPIDIRPKKTARQKRSVATVDAIVEAATYILRDHGPGRFTTNRVAERAGVNVASIYQYFPNKEALLFHVVKTTWDRQLKKLKPIVARPDLPHSVRLREFIREFVLIEAAETDLRQALRIASVDLKDTPEFRELMNTGSAMTRGFIEDAVIGQRNPGELDFYVNFVVLLVTSFAERATDERTSTSDLIRQADLLSDMLIARFGIA